MDELISAAEAIRAGSVVGVPTDTVYGLAVDPTDQEAVQRVFDLKGRAGDAPLVVLAADIDQAAAIGELDGRALADASEHWPGALTVIVPSRGSLAPGVGHPVTGTIGLRVPDHEVCRRLLEVTGPLAVTSANRSGAAPAVAASEAADVFGPAVVVYVPGTCPGGASSTVVDYTSDPPRIVRPGPVTIAGSQDG
jgi:tRNA threonylcarbamoyl adenosine modification protein (Sua5/YciO/YrdC/YwlC family)